METTPQRGTRSPWKRLTEFFFRLFGRKKKFDPILRLKDIDREKQAIIPLIKEISQKMEKLEARIDPLYLNQREVATRIQESSHQEATTSDASVRRALERGRWQFSKRQRLFEEERWNILDILRKGNTELHSLRLELLTLQAEEGSLEREIEKKILHKHDPQKATGRVSETLGGPTTVNLKGTELAKKHIHIKDIFLLAFRTFRVKPGMTLLTVLGIGVSFATIFFLVSLGYGLERVLLSQFSSEVLLRTLDVQTPSPEAVPLDEHAKERISALPGVEHVEPVLGLSGQIDSGALASEAQLRGTDPEYFSLSGGVLKEGRVYQKGEHAIVLTSNFLATMHKQSLADFSKPFSIAVYRPHRKDEGEGVEIIHLGDDFRVVGIIDDEENPNVFLSPEFISSMVPQYSALKVLVVNETVTLGLRSAIADEGFMSSSVVDTVDQATKVFKVVEIILALFGAASLMVATIGMVNTMTVSLLERTQEIGIMKVLGVSDSDVRRLFLLEASIIGGLGGVSGLVIGIVASQVFNMFINFLAKNLGGNSVSLFYYPLWFVVAIVLSAFVIGFLTGLVPSRRASNMDPLNAVKYK